MKSILFIFALENEAQIIIKKLRNRKRKSIANGYYYEGFYHRHFIYLLITGMGGSNVNKQLGAFLKEVPISIIVSSGISGGISSDINFGDLIIQKSILKKNINNDIQKLDTNITLINKIVELLKEKNIPFYLGDGLTVQNVINSVDDKNSLLAFPISAIDMESFTILEISNRHRIPLLSVRVILDTVQEYLPDFTGFVDDFGQIHLFSLIATVIKNPLLLGRMISIAMKMKTIRKKIDFALQIIIQEIK